MKIVKKSVISIIPIRNRCEFERLISCARNMQTTEEKCVITQALQTFTTIDTISIVQSCYEVQQCNTFLYEFKGVILMEDKQHVTRKYS